MVDAGAGSSAPTGCYKCGRPGHWSRDCPSSSSGVPNPASSIPLSSSSFPKAGGSTSANKSLSGKPATEKPKKVPKVRPKLTAEILLSENGLGYILRHFPRNFKCRGRKEHVVSDLRNLLRMYAEWHSHLLPYYSFDQFVHKVEQVGSSKRVRLCLRQLREKVANGVDLTKLKDLNNHEEPTLNEDPTNFEEASHQQTPCTNMDDDDQPQDIVEEIFNQAVNETSETIHAKSIASNGDPSCREVSPAKSSAVQISEEQRTRMEASRKKALERAAARARLSAASL